MKLGRRPSAGGQCFTLLAWAVVSFSLVVHAEEPADAPPAKQGAELTKRIRVLNQKGEPVVGATVIPWAVRSKQGHGAWRVADAYDAEPPKMITDAEGRRVVRVSRVSRQGRPHPADGIYVQRHASRLRDNKVQRRAGCRRSF